MNISFYKNICCNQSTIINILYINNILNIYTNLSENISKEDYFNVKYNNIYELNDSYIKNNGIVNYYIYNFNITIYNVNLYQKDFDNFKLYYQIFDQSNITTSINIIISWLLFISDKNEKIILLTNIIDLILVIIDYIKLLVEFIIKLLFLI